MGDADHPFEDGLTHLGRGVVDEGAVQLQLVDIHAARLDSELCPSCHADALMFDLPEERWTARAAFLRPLFPHSVHWQADEGPLDGSTTSV